MFHWYLNSIEPAFALSYLQSTDLLVVLVDIGRIDDEQATAAEQRRTAYFDLVRHVKAVLALYIQELEGKLYDITK